MNHNIEKNLIIIVLSGEISGMQGTLDLAETGIKVYLVDSKPVINAEISMFDKTFLTNDCAMHKIVPSLVDIPRHKDLNDFHNKLTG